MEAARTMLVHKKTLGVLQWYWDGVSYLTYNGETLPKMAAVTRETYELDPEDWWEVPNGTPLARKIALSYPFFDPVVTDGELVGARVWPAWKRYGEQPPGETAPPPRRRTYNRRRTRT